MAVPVANFVSPVLPLKMVTTEVASVAGKGQFEPGRLRCGDWSTQPTGYTKLKGEWNTEGQNDRWQSVVVCTVEP